jgi:hypothetical protein
MLVGGLHPVQDARFGSDADELRDAIGVEQETVHRSTSRPVSLSRSNSSSRPTNGDSRKNWTRLFLGGSSEERSAWRMASSASGKAPLSRRLN